MRRSPKMKLSTWLKTNSDMDRPWVVDAKCAWFLDLSWISDTTPTDAELTQMRGICEGCPIRLDCAAWATTADNGRGVLGGFYAGVWIPWANSTETEGTRSARTKGRRRLREMAALAGSA